MEQDASNGTATTQSMMKTAAFTKFRETLASSDEELNDTKELRRESRDWGLRKEEGKKKKRTRGRGGAKCSLEGGKKVSAGHQSRRRRNGREMTKGRRAQLGISRHQKHLWKALSPNMHTGALITTMCRLLREPKKHLIEIIVDDIGHAMAVQIMHETKQVLHKGGMRRVDGNGLRKPGGVFITILRKHITDENYKQLMKDAKKKWGKIKRKQQEEIGATTNNRSSGGSGSNIDGCEQTNSKMEISMVDKQEEQTIGGVSDQTTLTYN